MTTSVTTTPAQLAAIKQVQADGSPQQKTILAHLLARRREGLSQFEARKLYRIAALSRRITDLIEAGVPIRRDRELACTRYALDI